MLSRYQSPILCVLVAGCCMNVFAAPPPFVRITEPTRSLITDHASIRLHGVAVANSPIDSIYGVDQRGTRIPAEWGPVLERRQSITRWTIETPLRHGANLINVVVVDSENSAGSAQISVHRSGTVDAPTAVQSGMWRGSPVTYAVIQGTAILDGDIVLGNAAELSGNAEAPPGGTAGVTSRRLEARPLGFTASHTSLLWPVAGGVHQIPYTIESGSPNVAPAISSVNTALAGVLQFVPQTSEANFVTFNLSPSMGGGEGCQSSVGMVGG